MAFTFTTLKQAIQDYLETNETTLVTNLPTIITQAEERILKTVQLPNFRKNVTGTTTQSNSYLETPSDFLAPYSLAVDGSLVEAYTFLKGEPDLMQLYQARYDSAMQELIALGEGYSTTDSYRSGAVRSAR
jgi:hypothetical protein